MEKLWYLIFFVIYLPIFYITFFKNELIYKIFWIPIYNKWDKFIFEWIWKFKIINYYKHFKSYDCEFYEFEEWNIERKTYKVISEIEIKTNILIHKIDNLKWKFILWDSINIEWDWNI